MLVLGFWKIGLVQIRLWNRLEKKTDRLKIVIKKKCEVQWKSFIYYFFDNDGILYEISFALFLGVIASTIVTLIITTALYNIL